MEIIMNVSKLVVGLVVASFAFSTFALESDHQMGKKVVAGKKLHDKKVKDKREKEMLFKKRIDKNNDGRLDR
jgi:hypothetical protein